MLLYVLLNHAIRHCSVCIDVVRIVVVLYSSYAKELLSCIRQLIEIALVLATLGSAAEWQAYK